MRHGELQEENRCLRCISWDAHNMRLVSTTRHPPGNENEAGEAKEQEPQRLHVRIALRFTHYTSHNERRAPPRPPPRCCPCATFVGSCTCEWSERGGGEATRGGIGVGGGYRSEWAPPCGCDLTHTTLAPLRTGARIGFHLHLLADPHRRLQRKYPRPNVRRRGLFLHLQHRSTRVG
jgi:hypothetical protein